MFGREATAHCDQVIRENPANRGTETSAEAAASVNNNTQTVQIPARPSSGGVVPAPNLFYARG